MALTVAASGKGLMSMGRVQTPTLSLIAGAHLANKNFKSEAYYSLSVILSKNEAHFKAIYDLKFKTLSDATAELERVATALECTDKEVKEVVEGAPLLFDLSSLQQEANKKHGFKAQKTLDIMQALYEKHKVLTYPRTNSRYLSEDMKGDTLKIIQDVATGSGSLAEAANTILKKDLSKKPFNNEKITDHHAIIPTGKKPVELTGEENIIYSAVVVRFIQAFMEPAKKLKTTLKFSHGPGAFVANGSQLLVPGWRAPEHGQREERDEVDEEAETEQLLPEVSKGERLLVKKKNAGEKFTKPPALLNEASLLRLMETAGKTIADEELKEALKDIGIGTSATRAAIIERLFKVEYIINQGKSLVATEKGLAVYYLVKDRAIGSAELTGQWEQKLNLIAAGKYSAETFNREIKTYTTEIVAQLKATGKNLEIAPGGGAILCPKCKKGVIKTTVKAYGCSAYKEGCDFVIWKQSFGKDISQKMAEQIINKGSSALVKFTSKEGREYQAKLGLGEDFKLKMIFQNNK